MLILQCIISQTTIYFRYDKECVITNEYDINTEFYIFIYIVIETSATFELDGW